MADILHPSSDPAAAKSPSQADRKSDPPRKNSFFKNVRTMTGTTVVAQIVALAALPFLGRLYQPLDFGVYGLYLGVVMTASVIASGRYNMAVLLPDGSGEARSLLALSLRVLLGFVLLSTLGALAAYPWMSSYLGSHVASSFIVLIPISILLVGFTQSMLSWASRFEQYRLIAVVRVSQIVVATCVSLLLGVVGVQHLGLVLGFVAGQLVGALIVGYRHRTVLFRVGTRHSSSVLAGLARKYQDFPKINAVHALVGGFADSGLGAVVVALYGPIVGGHYSMAYRVTRAPMSLVGAAFAQVFYQESVVRGNSRSLEPFVVRTIFNLGLIAILPGIALILFGPVVFVTVLGEPWREAGVLAQIFAPWLLLSFIASSISSLPTVADRLGKAFRLAVADLFGKACCIFMGALTGDMMLGFVLLSVVSTLVLLYQLVWYVGLARWCDANGLPWNASEEVVREP